MKRVVVVGAIFNVLFISFFFGAYFRQPDTTCYLDAARRIVGSAAESDCGYRLLKPLPVLFAGLFERITGFNAMYGLFFQNVVFYILASLLLFEIIRLVFTDERQALLAVVMFGTAPPFLVFGLAYLTDMMGWFWALFVVYGTLRFNARAFLIGIISGIGFLYKESALGGLIFFGAYTIFDHHLFWREKMRRCFVAGIGFMIPVGISTIFVYWFMGYTFLDWLQFAWSKPFGDEYRLFYFLKNSASVLYTYWFLFIVGVYAFFRAYRRGAVSFDILLFLIAGLATIVLWFVWSYPAARIFYLSAPFLLSIVSYGAIFLGFRRGALLIFFAAALHYILVWHALTIPGSFIIFVMGGIIYAIFFAAVLLGPARAGVFFATVVLILISGEVSLRLLGYSGERIERDSRTGFMTFIPGSVFTFQKSCLRNQVLINGAGFHDFEFMKEKASGTVRIVVLGDSYVEAFHVPRAQAFHNLLEEKLNAAYNGSPRFEVLAFGMSGNGTFSNYLYLQKYALSYKPDIVINAFLVGNDFRNDSAALSKESGLTMPTLFPVWSQDGSLDIASVENHVAQKIANPSLFFLKKMARRSAFIMWAYPRYYATKAVLAGVFDSTAPLPVAGSSASMFLVDDQVFLKEYPEVWRAVWRDEERLLALMRRAAEDAGARFMLMSLTEGFRVHPNLMQKKGFSPAMTALLDFEKPERLLAGIALRHQIPYLPLVPFFQKHAGDSATVFLCDGHWNEYGHALAAEALFDFLRSQPLLLKPEREPLGKR